jgi:hypothetical protein
MMAAIPITKCFMGCKDDIPFFLLRVAVLQLKLRGWGMVTVVPIFIYINIEVNNGVRWDGKQL